MDNTDESADGSEGAAGGEETTRGHYANESAASLDLLRKKVGAPAPARSLCLLTRVNETFPKHSSYSLPTSESGFQRHPPPQQKQRLSEAEHKSFDNDADLLIPDADLKVDISQDGVKKGEAGMHFYVNGYKLPSSAAGIKIKHFL